MARTGRASASASAVAMEAGGSEQQTHLNVAHWNFVLCAPGDGGACGGLELPAEGVSIGSLFVCRRPGVGEVGRRDVPVGVDASVVQAGVGEGGRRGRAVCGGGGGRHGGRKRSGGGAGGGGKGNTNKRDMKRKRKSDEGKRVREASRQVRNQLSLFISLLNLRIPLMTLVKYSPFGWQSH